MNGAPKHIQTCPAHPGRGTRYRPQPLTHPTPFATSPFSFPTNPTHTDPLTKATQEPRYPRPLSTNLSYTLPRDRRRAHGDTEAMIQHPYPTPRTPDSAPLRIQSSTEHPDKRNAPPRRPRTTYGSPTAGTRHPQTDSKRQSHRERSTACTSYPRQIPHITLSLPQCSDQPTNPTAIPDCTRALPTHGNPRP